MKSYPFSIQGLKEYFKTFMVMKVIYVVNEFNQISNRTFFKKQKKILKWVYTQKNRMAISFLNPKNKTNKIMLSDFHTTIQNYNNLNAIVTAQKQKR